MTEYCAIRNFNDKETSGFDMQGFSTVESAENYINEKNVIVMMSLSTFAKLRSYYDAVRRH